VLHSGDVVIGAVARCGVYDSGTGVKGDIICRADWGLAVEDWVERVQRVLEAETDELRATEAEELGDIFEGAAGCDICEEAIRDEERPVVAGANDDIVKIRVYGETCVRGDGPRSCRPDKDANAGSCI
jgi:hypothetical protein